ncbi:MAG: aminomethyltransferase family protein [Halobacteriaceae archaeon]
MTVVRSKHEDFGAVFDADGAFPAHYGRPERTHTAVRRIVGVRESDYGVLAVRGEDRVDFVDNTVSNRVPDEDGEGVYALLLDPDGNVEADLYVFAAGERLLVFTPQGREATIAEEWRSKTFVQDVDIEVVTDDFGVFGVHGPKATEKVASVLGGPGTPEGPLSFVRGRVRTEGVTVIRGDGLAGEEGYEVVCTADAAAEVFDALVTHGLNAVPFGRRSWETLTLEAGTPLFETELDGQLANAAGVRNGLDFEKGCFVGQETVARIENLGNVPRHVVGLAPERLPEAGAPVLDDGAEVGTVTRAVESPTLEAPIAMARVDFDAAPDAVGVGDETVSAEHRELPFVDGSERSARLPTY